MGFGGFLKKAAGFVANPQIVSALAGGAIQYAADRKAQKLEAQVARESTAANVEMARRNEEMQREFAQHGIQWRAEDAARAGINPLAALGAGGAAFAPGGAVQVGDMSRADFTRRTGQNISRALAATMDVYQRKAQALELENRSLENEMLKTRIASERRSLSLMGPGFPRASLDPLLTGQGDVFKGVGEDPRVVDVPLRRTVSDPRDVSREAGALPDWQIVRGPQGGYAVVPGAEVKQRIEDQWLAEMQWHVRMNRAGLSGKLRLPDGSPAVVNPLTGELVPVSEAKRWLSEKMFGKGGYRGMLNRIRGR